MFERRAHCLRFRLGFLATGLCVWLFASVAFAEDEPETGEGSEAESEASTEDEWSSRSSQLGVTVGLPFYDERIIHPDMTVDIRYGRKISWFVPYFSAGFRQARLDPKRVPRPLQKMKLDAWHMTIGVRVEVPVSRYILPFAGIAGELAHMGYQGDSTEHCGDPYYPDAWRCYEPYQWKAARAFKAQVGFLYKPQPDLALEFWVERGYIVAPEKFTRTVTFITPSLGFAWHH
jgi:hypothetical protein